MCDCDHNTTYFFPSYCFFKLCSVGIILPNLGWSYSTHDFSIYSFSFFFFLKMGFYHDGQAGLELLTSGDPPTSASQIARITGVSHCVWSNFLLNVDSMVQLSSLVLLPLALSKCKLSKTLCWKEDGHLCSIIAFLHLHENCVFIFGFIIPIQISAVIFKIYL